MELRQLEYFMITCEKGSFNQAAECLLHHTAQCQQGNQFPGKELGRPLFERSSRGIPSLPMVKQSGNMPRIFSTMSA